MTVKKLIEILQRIENQESEIFIAESQYDWENVLVYVPNPANADEAVEVHL